MQIPELRVEENIYPLTFPNFGRPNIIGYIGLENLKFARNVSEQSVVFDLNLHYEKAIHKPADFDPKLTELLKFLLEHKARLNFSRAKTLDRAQFFCYRGLLTRVACTPYERRDPWKIVVVLYKGNIFLCAKETDNEIERKYNMSKREQLCSSWGYKFEQYLLSDEPTIDPNPNAIVNENEEFSLVFTTHLKKHSLVYAAEMDGIRCDPKPVEYPPSNSWGPDAIIKYLSKQEFIELKTYRHIQNFKQDNIFKRHKTKKWWCQSFLAGVNTILCGFRNDEGIVERLKIYELKNLTKTSENFWNANVCFNFLDIFFKHIKRCLARKIKYRHGEKALENLQTLPLISMLFEWSPGIPIHVNENYIYEDDPILPQWFTDNYYKCNEEF